MFQLTVVTAAEPNRAEDRNDGVHRVKLQSTIRSQNIPCEFAEAELCAMFSLGGTYKNARRPAATVFEEEGSVTTKPWTVKSR